MLCTITEMAAHYQVSTAAIYYRIKHGKLPDPRVKPVPLGTPWPTRTRNKSTLRIAPAPSTPLDTNGILIQKVCELEEKVNMLIDHIAQSNIVRKAQRALGEWRSVN